MWEAKLIQSVCNVFDPLQKPIKVFPFIYTCSFPLFSVLWSHFSLISVRPSYLFPITSPGDVFQTSADVHITAFEWSQLISANSCLISASAVFSCVLAPKPLRSLHRHKWKVFVFSYICLRCWKDPTAQNIETQLLSELQMTTVMQRVNLSHLDFIKRAFFFPSADQCCSSRSTTISKLFWNVEEKNYNVPRATDSFFLVFETRFRHLSV